MAARPQIPQAQIPPWPRIAGGALPSLRGQKICDLVVQVRDKDAAIDWAMQHGVIAGTRMCRNCPGAVAMQLEVANGGDGKRWRCPTRGC